MSTLPIEIVPVDVELAKIAAEFKAGQKMSYADCFAAALGKLRHAEVVTGDEDFRRRKGGQNSVDPVDIMFFVFCFPSYVLRFLSPRSLVPLA
jgi:hypothetical protein